MKQYVIDQLRESDYNQILEFLNKNADSTVLGEIYHLNFPPDLYTKTQSEHAECHPYYFAVNLDYNHVAFELLIRSHQRLRCNCIGYASLKQREYILGYADKMLEQLGIRL